MKKTWVSCRNSWFWGVNFNYRILKLPKCSTTPGNRKKSECKHAKIICLLCRTVAGEGGIGNSMVMLILLMCLSGSHKKSKEVSPPYSFTWGDILLPRGICLVAWRWLPTEHSSGGTDPLAGHLSTDLSKKLQKYIQRVRKCSGWSVDIELEDRSAQVSIGHWWCWGCCLMN